MGQGLVRPSLAAPVGGQVYLKAAQNQKKPARPPWRGAGLRSRDSRCAPGLGALYFE